MLPAVGALGYGLGDDVQRPARNQLKVRHHKRFQPGAEAAAGAAHSLGHGTDLAVVFGQERDDPVGFAQLMGAQHDGIIPVRARRK